MKTEDFKGIYYKNKKPRNYYEGGAHFKYSDLVDALTKLESSKNNKIHSLQKIGKIKNETHRFKFFAGKKINANLLTLSKNNKNRETYHYREHLSTDKYLFRKEREREREKDPKKRIMELINFNIKVSPFKNSMIINKKYYCNNSLNSNNKIKLKNSFGESSNNKTQIVKDYYLKTQANQEKKVNFELPLIKPIYNFNNKSIEKKKNKSRLDLKFMSQSRLVLNKTKKSKDNLFQNHKLLALNREKYFGTSEFGNDKFFETLKNSSNYETIEIYAKKSEYNFGKKAIKHLFSKKSSLRLTNNLKIIH